MSSVIEGYNYDIFISYRQKDNKYDGWVTEFVENLKGELGSTFKEDISVYFDISPHDGLLETHDVGETLKEKLKCLIFIPIISRTYCDPKSFAWEHEFISFIEQASHDQFGLKVKIANGNVCSRILPVRIHDLDNDDVELLESVLGGPLRSVDFIYQTAGVNRPLRTIEDHPQDNLNKTYFRDQVNKVANSIKEIITAIRQNNTIGKEVSREVFKPELISGNRKKTPIIAGSAVVLVLMILGLIFIPKLCKPEIEIERSIAVLPFRNDSPDQENAQFTNGTMEAIMDNLCKIKDLRVISRTSVEQYRNTTKSIPQIGKELNVSYILEGSGQKYGDDIKLTVQLIEAANDRHIWSSPYKRKFEDIFIIQSEIARTIAAEIKAVITPEEIQLIQKIPTSNFSAYDLYLKANEYKKKYLLTYDPDSYQSAVNFYKASLDIDSTFARAYTGMAWVYLYRSYWKEFFQENFLDSCMILINKALNIDDKVDEAYYLKGMCYWQRGNINEAINNADKALKINPNFYMAYAAKGYLYSVNFSDYVKCLDNYRKALSLVGGDERPPLLRDIGNRYADLGFIETANNYYKEAFTIDKNQKNYLERQAWLEFDQENYEESLRLIKKIQEVDSTSWLYNLSFYLYPPGHDEEAFVNARKIIERSKKYGTTEINQMHRIGYIYYKMGRIKEANDFFRQQIKYCEESIKLNRFYSQTKDAQYDMAATYAFLGNKKKAYEYLDEFNSSDFYTLGIISFVKNDPMFTDIRNEERFKKIIQNMESKNRAEHERVRKWEEEEGRL